MVVLDIWISSFLLWVLFLFESQFFSTNISSNVSVNHFPWYCQEILVSYWFFWFTAFPEKYLWTAFLMPLNFNLDILVIILEQKEQSYSYGMEIILFEKNVEEIGL